MKFCDTLVLMALLLELCFDLFRVVDRYVDFAWRQYGGLGKIRKSTRSVSCVCIAIESVTCTSVRYFSPPRRIRKSQSTFYLFVMNAVDL
jgi:hypothetical protein